MKLVFFGTPIFSARILAFLSQQNIPLQAIVTQPDRPKGRRKQITPSPVKIAAKKLYPEVEILQPENARDAHFIQKIRDLAPDYFIVVGYGQILSQELLSIPNILPVNIHTSFLPKYRGAAPMQRALMQGEIETGVTLMEMNTKMDEGDILLQEKVAAPQEMTFGMLESALEKVSCALLTAFFQGKIERKKQDHTLATYAPKITTEERRIVWHASAESIHNLIRALSPSPGAWSRVEIQGEKKRVKIFLSKVLDPVSSLSLLPGEVKIDKKSLQVGSGKGALEIFSLQLEGRNQVSAPEFLAGFGTSLTFF